MDRASTTRKHFRAWAGTPQDIEQLATKMQELSAPQIAAALADLESRSESTSESFSETYMREQAVKRLQDAAPKVKLIVVGKGFRDTIEGSVSEIVERPELFRASEVTLRIDPGHGCGSQTIRFQRDVDIPVLTGDYEAQITVEGNDANWTTGTAATLHQELRLGRPAWEWVRGSWWALLPSVVLMLTAWIFVFGVMRTWVAPSAAGVIASVLAAWSWMIWLPLRRLYWPGLQIVTSRAALPSTARLLFLMTVIPFALAVIGVVLALLD